jgi:hypothetical protein
MFWKRGQLRKFVLISFFFSGNPQIVWRSRYLRSSMRRASTLARGIAFNCITCAIQNNSVCIQVDAMFDLESCAAKRKKFRQSESAARLIRGKCGKDVLQNANHGNAVTLMTRSDALNRPRFSKRGLAA